LITILKTLGNEKLVTLVLEDVKQIERKNTPSHTEENLRDELRRTKDQLKEVKRQYEELLQTHRDTESAHQKELQKQQNDIEALQRQLYTLKIPSQAQIMPNIEKTTSQNSSPKSKADPFRQLLVSIGKELDTIEWGAMSNCYVISQDKKPTTAFEFFWWLFQTGSIDQNRLGELQHLLEQQERQDLVKKFIEPWISDRNQASAFGISDSVKETFIPLIQPRKTEIKSEKKQSPYVEQILAMGFTDVELVERILTKNNGDVGAAVLELLN